MEAIDIVQKWVEERKTDLIANYNQKGLKASGAFENGLTVSNTETSVVLTAPQHFGAMIYGRKKTTGSGDGSLKKVILKWINDKGIKPYDKITNESLSFLIARKIHKEGIIVPNKFNDGKLYSDTFTQEKFDELYKLISNDVILTIKQQTKETWRQ